jgi:hypothetical protein
MPVQPSIVDDEAILQATGAPWTHWLEVFSLMDAKHLSHEEITQRLRINHQVPNEWCEMLASKFEQESKEI